MLHFQKPAKTEQLLANLKTCGSKKGKTNTSSFVVKYIVVHFNQIKVMSYLDYDLNENCETINYNLKAI